MDKWNCKPEKHFSLLFFFFKFHTSTEISQPYSPVWGSLKERPENWLAETKNSHLNEEQSNHFLGPFLKTLNFIEGLDQPKFYIL